MMKKLNKTNQNKARGFTLIELLVVVTVLAALAGMTSMALDGYQQDAEEKLTRVEMQRIANAIRRFKEDTGYWPKTGIFKLDDITTPATIESYKTDYYANQADLRWLFFPPEKFIEGQKYTGSGWEENKQKHPLWDIEYAIGWNGPYIDIPAAREIAPSDAANCYKSLSNASKVYTHNEMDALTDASSGLHASMYRRSIGIVDRFERNWQRNSYNNHCIMTLTKDSGGNRQYTPDPISGSPYLYDINYTDSGTCAGTNGCIALISFGPNSQAGDGDDILYILQVNQP